MSEQRRSPPPVAVALRYDGESAPRVTAKGYGAVAEKIIALADEHAVPLYEDAELVGLLAQLELGDEIPRELYIAAAQVLAFAYFISGKVAPAQTQG